MEARPIVTWVCLAIEKEREEREGLARLELRHHVSRTTNGDKIEAMGRLVSRHVPRPHRPPIPRPWAPRRQRLRRHQQHIQPNGRTGPNGLIQVIVKSEVTLSEIESESNL